MASVIEDGNYYVRSASDTSLCMDSYGATDESGAAVSAWPQNGTDAQLVHVTNVDGGVALSFPLTGCALDVPNAALVAGAELRQWTWSDAEAQRFVLTDGGSTVSVGGRPLKAVRLAAKGDRSLMVTAGSAMGQGRRLSLAKATGTDAQLWAFEPVAAPMSGTYEVIPAANDGYALDVEGCSSADGARVITYTRNAKNNQRLWVYPFRDGLVRAVWCHSMRFMEVYGDGVHSGVENHARVQQYGGWREGDGEDGPGRDDSMWGIVPRGTMRVNGATVPTYELRNLMSSGTTYCLDVNRNDVFDGGAVQMYERNLTDAQRFALVPSDMHDQSLPVPASVGLAVGGRDYGSGTVADPSEARVSFLCPARAYKARFRVRARRAGGELGGWGQWLNVRTGLAANDGWGASGQPDFEFADSSSRRVLPTPLALPGVSAGGTDCVEVQAMVRAYEADQGGRRGLHARGTSGQSETIRVAATPRLTIASATVGPDGLTLAYESDWRGGGCTLRVAGIGASGGGSWDLASRERSFSGLDGSSGSVTIPWEDMGRAPRAGEVLSVGASLLTDLRTRSDGAPAVTLGDAPRRRDPECEAFVSPGATDRVSVVAGGADALRAWELTGGHGREMPEVRAGADGRRELDALCPLDRESRALVVIRRADGSWGATDVALPAITGHSYVWNWPGGHAELSMGLGEPARRADSTSRDHAAYATTGREYRAYRFTGGAERDLSVSGCVVAGGAGDPWGALDALLRAGHATFRDRFGTVCDVAVTAVSHPRQWDTHGEATVTQFQESR